MRMIREHPLIAGTAMLALLAWARRSVRNVGELSIGANKGKSEAWGEERPERSLPL